MSLIHFPSGRELDAIPVGRITIDFNPVDYFKPWAQCETFKKYVGGSPANIAVGLARLGKKAGFLGRISDDQMGDFCESFFLKEGIDISHIIRCRNGESMGLAFTEILDENHSGLMMYRTRAADLMLHPDDVDENYIKKSRMLIVSGTALSTSPSREAVLKAIELARKNDTVIVFDIDYRSYTWKSRDEIALYYTLAARQADIIMGSKEEYALMDSLTSPGLSDCGTAGKWLDERAKIVVIKHGKEGSAAYTADGCAFSIRPFPVKALKGFGGGDGYGSAFLSCLLDGYEIIDCLEHGSASAAMLVSSHGCSPDMPSMKELEAFIQKEKEIYGEMIARC